jgi:hypothetical protein
MLKENKKIEIFYNIIDMIPIFWTLAHENVLLNLKKAKEPFLKLSLKTFSLRVYFSNSFLRILKSVP